LTVSDGRHAASIALFGSYIAGSFVLGADGHGGTLVRANAAPAAHAPARLTWFGGSLTSQLGASFVEMDALL
jgi:hypothetical protein